MQSNSPLYVVMASYFIHGRAQTQVSQKMSLKLAKLTAKLLKKNQARYASVDVIPLWS